MQRTLLVVLAIYAAIAAVVGATGKTSHSGPRESLEGAIAISLEHFYRGTLAIIPLEEDGVVYRSISICVETSSEVDFSSLNQNFFESKIIAWPIGECSIRVMEEEEWRGRGPRERFYDPNGEQAEDILVESHCQSDEKCILELEVWFRRDRYITTRSSDGWTIQSQDNLILRD